MKQINKAVKLIKIFRQDQLVVFFVHISVWLLLFFAFYFFSLQRNESLPVFIVLLYLYGFILFYLNYFLLTPQYLLPKKYLKFSISVIMVILFSFFVIDPLIHQMTMDDFVRNAPPEFRNMPPFIRIPDELPSGKLPELSLRPQGMFFLLFTFLISSSSVRIFQKLKREENINQEYRHEKLNAELMMLRQQINPHFLFNSLNNILSLANRKSDQTVEAIVKLSAILRHMLNENPQNEIPVTREISVIQSYIDLQKLWMTNMITVDFLVDNVKDSYFIEPFILNPLVENAFKYGALPGVGSTISIHISMDGDWLHFKAGNPVVGEKPSEVSSMGIGLNNVIRRLELCYPGKYKIEITQKENKYMVNLSIKLKKQ